VIPEEVLAVGLTQVFDDFAEVRRVGLKAQFFGLVERVSKGFPLSAATNIIQRIDPDGRFMRVTDIIPKSTFHRKERNKQPLSKDESEKVLALSKVFSEALRIYKGDQQKCAQFLANPHPMLGSRSPLELARESIAGADLVLKMLSKADAGVAV